jgi:hypothetical protein
MNTLNQLMKFPPFIREALFGSNIGEGTGCPKWVSHCLPQTLQENFRIIPLLGSNSFLPDPFQFNIHHIIRHYMTLLMKALLNKTCLYLSCEAASKQLHSKCPCSSAVTRTQSRHLVWLYMFEFALCVPCFSYCTLFCIVSFMLQTFLVCISVRSTATGWILNCSNTIITITIIKITTTIIIIIIVILMELSPSWGAANSAAT